MCEIDKRVVELSKEFLPEMANGYSDPRATLFIGDGLKFMSERENEFDVIITDSSDPVGPAESLFGEEYYKLVKRSLRSGGIACSQAESIWLHLDTISSMVNTCKSIFPSVEYAWSNVPTYPCGAIGYLVVASSPCNHPARPIPQNEQAKMRYYNEEIHAAAFKLPQFAKVKLGL